MDRFIECWEGLDDPRTGNAALHDLHEILAIAMCAVLCGAQGSVDMGLFAKSKEPIRKTPIVCPPTSSVPAGNSSTWRTFRGLYPGANSATDDI